MEKRWLRHYESGVPPDLDVPDTTLSAALRDTAGRFPGRTAMTFEASRWSYRELDALVDRMAHVLAARDIRSGGRVGIDLPNSPQFVVAYFGILRAGAIAGRSIRSSPVTISAS